jgi:hypothetical protein
VRIKGTQPDSCVPVGIARTSSRAAPKVSPVPSDTEPGAWQMISYAIAPGRRADAHGARLWTPIAIRSAD